MKYTKDQRLDIGRRIYEGEITFFNEQRPAYSLNYLTPKQFREQFATYHNC